MLIALVGKAYTGKTSIARELVDRHGFTLLSFTDHLKGLAAYALNSVRGGSQLVTVADILADKPKYRRFIQEFGALIGYETDPGWITAFLADAQPDLDPDGIVRPTIAQDVVVDCLRSSAQIAGAREFGAKIVGLDVNKHNRAVFAALAGGAAAGFDYELVEAADCHPIDGNLDVDHLDCDIIVPNNTHTTPAAVVDDILEGLPTDQAEAQWRAMHGPTV